MTPFEFILNKLKDSSINDLRQQAYVLATINHETFGTFKPVLEGYYLGANRIQKLYNYYQQHNPKAIRTIFPNGIEPPTYEGRGFVQTTHIFNYRIFGELLGIDLVKYPDKAMEPDTAWDITEIGMTKGLFTSHNLNMYFNDKLTDWIGARRIINGLDKAEKIAAEAQEYYAKLISQEPIDINSMPSKGFDKIEKGI